MGEHPVLVARFSLHTRCHNCRRLMVMSVDVPDEEDAPTTVDDLVESALILRLPFSCSGCQHNIGTLVAVKKLPLPAQEACYA
ncbi:MULTISPECIES: hypothetical protein [unclassified Chelatococcus]|uniref:hypothetical protein n=1 Tax=unclassified Chelatococcus TaxID=2638111 RepID=UPI001BD1B6EC|nr:MULTISPECIES: hypothetical protein [unclassified Chelatococcus]CAH1670577.1 conserved hypothetical protein [Hyphomicrobiales bacterium]MBS7738355.1 hypothetical protein [Chelatococcus sp. HY11]MBX3545883.1 hypothetical protein [Chelatococcus sp.]MCO5077299.1 hypothetical protein [Chelatococcus sp.]CAH1677189.1 conserved hypothetical protein [Hyphomicrobiales bacterium]